MSGWGSPALEVVVTRSFVGPEERMLSDTSDPRRAVGAARVRRWP